MSCNTDAENKTKGGRNVEEEPELFIPFTGRESDQIIKQAQHPAAHKGCGQRAELLSDPGFHCALIVWTADLPCETVHI